LEVNNGYVIDKKVLSKDYYKNPFLLLIQNDVFTVNFKFQMPFCSKKEIFSEFFFGKKPNEVSSPFKCIIKQIYKNFIYKPVKKIRQSCSPLFVVPK
jgi:hypothetical protein